VAFCFFTQQAQQLSLLLYGHPLDTRQITQNHYDALRTKQLTDQTQKRDLRDFVTLLAATNTINSDDFYWHLCSLTPQFKQLKGETLFYQLLTLTFSKSGVDMLVKIMKDLHEVKKNKINLQPTKTNHFMIDLAAPKTLITLNGLTPTPQETKRYL
jgi:hypothetical protein